MPSATPRMLMQFEAIFLTESQIKSFNQLYKERKFSEQNPVFQLWLPLKLASQPTEAEALKSVLTARTPIILPKSTKKRAGRKVPDGNARFNPISPEWKVILEEGNVQDKKQKVTKGVGKLKGKRNIQQENDITEEEPQETKGRGKAKRKKGNSPEEDIPKKEQREAKGRGKAKEKKVVG